ncbi:MAG: hypothetical protein ICCCNLDF_00438 [Planctomycetes bacterium]|nr:hypothetical protein [Planctomycetota bacterium]
MGKLLHVAVYVFAVIGILMTAGVGYVYVANSQLMGEFWSVKDDFRAVPDERRTEVVAELPARITFEKEVAAEMAELPEERRAELYEQLTKSREQVYAQFKTRITAEAAVAREAKKAQKDVKQVAEEIEKKLGKVNVGIDLTGKGKSGPDNLADVNSAKGDVADARLAYGEALESRDGARRVTAAVGVLEALDKLGDKVQAARRKSLSADEKDRLSDVVKDAKATLYDVKQTPKLSDDAKAKKLMASIPQKLNE